MTDIDDFIIVPDATKVERPIISLIPKKGIDLKEVQEKAKQVRQKALQLSRQRTKSTKLVRKGKFAPNCIFTATDIYKQAGGKNERVTGNITFAEQPDHFYEIPVDKMQPGDLVTVQRKLFDWDDTKNLEDNTEDWIKALKGLPHALKKLGSNFIRNGSLVFDYNGTSPTHAMIYNGRNINGRHTFNYATGNTDPNIAGTEKDYRRGTSFEWGKELDTKKANKAIEKHIKVYRYLE